MSWENSPVERRTFASSNSSMLLRALSLAIVPSMLFFAPLSAQTLHLSAKSGDASAFGILIAANNKSADAAAPELAESEDDEEKPKSKEKKADEKKGKGKDEKAARDKASKEEKAAKEDKKDDKKEEKAKAKEAKDSKDSKDSKEAKEAKNSKDSKDDNKKAAVKRDFFGRARDEKAPAGKAAAPNPSATQAATQASTPGASATASGSASSEAKKSDKDKSDKEEKTLVFEPDSALLSVLKDLNRSIKDSEEFKKIEDNNERMIVTLASDVINKALADPKLAFNRILAKEHENKARTRLTTEAWSSGDIEINDKFHGSISTIWAKRIDGLVTVTVAGDCRDRKASDGHDVGEFLVVLTAHSPVVSGFDIQSQQDVNFWLGKLSNITVEADCVIKPVAQTDTTEGEKSEGDKPAAKPGRDIKSSVDEKKKSIAALPPLLTNRYRHFYEQMVLQDDRRRLIAQQLLAMDPSLTAEAEAEARKAAEAKAAAQSKEDENANAKADAKPDAKKAGVGASPKVATAKAAEKTKAVVLASGDDEETKATKTSIEPDEEEESDDSAEKKKAQIGDEKVSKKTDRKIAQNSERDSDSSNESADDGDAQSVKKGGNSEKIDNKQVAKVAVRAKGQEPAKVDAVKASTANNGDELASATTGVNQNAALAADAASGATLTMVTSATPRQQNNTNFKAGDKGSTRPYNKTAAKQNAQAKETLDAPKEGNETAYAGAAASMERITGLDLPALKQPKNFTMLMPERALAGQPLTVAFVDEQRNPESNVELSFNGVTLSTDHNGQAQYMIPEDETPGRSLNIALLSRPYEMPAVVEVIQPLATPDAPQAPKIDRASHLVSRRSTLVIDGHNFDGVAQNNRVIIDGVTEAAIAASSPVQLKVNLPRDLKPGKHSMCVSTEGMRSNPIGFELAQLEVSCDGKDAANKVTVKVIGTTTKVSVKLVNLTPDLIRLSKGDEVKLLSSGGADNVASVSAQRLKKGAVKVEAWLEI